MSAAKCWKAARSSDEPERRPLRRLSANGALTLMFAKSRNVILDFAGALRVSVVAVTPVIVIRTLLWIFFNTEPAWYLRWPAAIVITALYVRFAVNALGEERSPAFPAAPAPG